MQLTKTTPFSCIAGDSVASQRISLQAGKTRSAASRQLDAVTVDSSRPHAKDVQGEVLDLFLYFFRGAWLMMSSFLDESGPDGRSPVVCVSGVLYASGVVEKIDEEWKRALDSAGIKAFHTADYAHSKGEFRDMDPKVANALYIQLLGLIKKHAAGSVTAFSIPIKEEFDLFKGEWKKYSPYTVCGYVCMGMLLGYADILRDQDVSLVIESGNAKMGELDTLIDRQRKRGRLPRVKSVAFVSKDTRPLQSADVVAYEHRKRVKDMWEKPGQPMRKSLGSLIVGDDRHKSVVLNRPLMQKFYSSLQ